MHLFLIAMEIHLKNTFSGFVPCTLCGTLALHTPNQPRSSCARSRSRHIFFLIEPARPCKERCQCCNQRFFKNQGVPPLYATGRNHINHHMGATPKSGRDDNNAAIPRTGLRHMSKSVLVTFSCAVLPLSSKSLPCFTEGYPSSSESQFQRNGPRPAMR